MTLAQEGCQHTGSRKCQAKTRGFSHRINGYDEEFALKKSLELVESTEEELLQDEIHEHKIGMVKFKIA